MRSSKSARTAPRRPARTLGRGGSKGASARRARAAKPGGAHPAAFPPRGQSGLACTPGLVFQPGLELYQNAAQSPADRPPNHSLTSLTPCRRILRFADQRGTKALTYKGRDAKQGYGRRAAGTARSASPPFGTSAGIKAVPHTGR